MNLTTLSRAAVLSAAAVLAACGGGSDTNAPSVTNMGASSMMYGKSTTITVIGSGLNANLSATIEPGCPTMTRGTPSDTQLTFTCKIAALGDLRARVRTEGGAELASLRLTVETPRVSMTVAQTVSGVTSSNSFVMELDPVAAPITVTNFLTYVNTGSCFYKDTLFHRVVRTGFSIAQAGGFKSGFVAVTGVGAPIALESNNGLKNLKYTVAMARTSEPNSATSQFYINGTDNPAFDYVSADQPGYAVFGKLISGTDVYDVLQAVPTTTKTAETNGQPVTFADTPVDNVSITACSQIR
ncbi:peptidylprolyl isomerase [Aquabacterium sp.]|uniref:peptidylprolyl isomerase n=1 Tax=Aquabacterium sp. TaxID=1872578 RepID=UPI003784EF8E